MAKTGREIIILQFWNSFGGPRSLRGHLVAMGGGDVCWGGIENLYAGVISPFLKFSQIRAG